MSILEGAITPSGWYPDPADPASGGQRWWNGTAWTSDVRAGVDAASAAVPTDPAPLTRRRLREQEGALTVGEVDGGGAPIDAPRARTIELPADRFDSDRSTPPMVDAPMSSARRDTARAAGPVTIRRDRPAVRVSEWFLLVLPVVSLVFFWARFRRVGGVTGVPLVLSAVITVTTIALLGVNLDEIVSTATGAILGR